MALDVHFLEEFHPRKRPLLQLTDDALVELEPHFERLVQACCLHFDLYGKTILHEVHVQALKASLESEGTGPRKASQRDLLMGILDRALAEKKELLLLGD